MQSVDALKEGREHVEFRTEIASKLDNPLSGIPREQLARDVESFAHEKGLEEVRRTPQPSRLQIC